MIYIINDWLSNRYYFKITANLIIFYELSNLRLALLTDAVFLTLLCGLVGVTDSWCSGLVFACGESRYKAGDGVFKAVRYLPLRYGFWWPAAVLVNEPFL